MTVSSAPLRRATFARSSLRTRARTLTPRLVSSRNTRWAWRPVAPTIKTRIDVLPSTATCLSRDGLVEGGIDVVVNPVAFGEPERLDTLHDDLVGLWLGL